MSGKSGAIRAGGAFYELFTKNNPLVAGLQAAEGAVKASLGKAAKSAAAGMTSIAGSLSKLLTSPVTALAAAVAPLAAGHLFASMGAELTDISRRTGASVEALQTLGYAAKRTGQDLGAVEGALTTVRDKIIDAVRGSEEAQLTFRRLGLNFLQLSKMSPQDQLRKIAAALNAIPHPAIRAAMATELLGSTDLLPMLQDLDKAEARYKRLGLVLGTDVISAGNKLRNSFEDLHANMMATVSVIGAKISPAISELIDKWVEMSGHTRAWIANNTQMFGSAESLWAFIKLQWAKGSDYILSKFADANQGVQGVWVDTQAALESGWERFKHGAEHAFGSVWNTAKDVFKMVAELALKTVGALSTAFAYVSDEMSAALNKAANDLARLLKKANLAEIGRGAGALAAKLLDQDNPELQKKLAAIEAERQKKQAAINAQGGPNRGAQIAQLQKDYDDAVAKAKANAPKPPGEGEAGGHGRGMGGNHQPGFDTARMHVEGLGAHDVRSKEGFASVAASLRESQLAQQAYTLQQRQYQVERDTRDRITKITVVGRK